MTRSSPQKSLRAPQSAVDAAWFPKAPTMEAGGVFRTVGGNPVQWRAREDEPGQA